MEEKQVSIGKRLCQRLSVISAHVIKVDSLSIPSAQAKSNHSH